ncbi:hypothetical protein ON010_g9677 [Phytophthora cinnamomi]|nr:hypothetical protein ON010_g9677 [Phytophthora cinnamomi]
MVLVQASKHRSSVVVIDLLEAVGDHGSNEREVDHHRPKARVSNDEVQHQHNAKADRAAGDQRHVHRASRRVQRRQDMRQVSIARNSVQQLAHAEHERVEARNKPQNQHPREPRRDFFSAGGDHRVEDDGAKRQHDQGGDRRHKPNRHIPLRVDGHLDCKWQLLDTQVEPQRERIALDRSIPSTRVLPVDSRHPLTIRHLGRRANVKHQQDDHRHDRRDRLHAEGHLDAHDVERHEDDVEDGPPDRAVVGAQAQQLVHVRADARDHDGARDDDLEALGQTGEEGGARADGVQREDHSHERQDDEQPVEARHEARLPAEEVAAHDGAHAQRPQDLSSAAADEEWRRVPLIHAVGAAPTQDLFDTLMCGELQAGAIRPENRFTASTTTQSSPVIGPESRCSFESLVADSPKSESVPTRDWNEKRAEAGVAHPHSTIFQQLHTSPSTCHDAARLRAAPGAAAGHGAVPEAAAPRREEGQRQHAQKLAEEGSLATSRGEDDGRREGKAAVYIKISSPKRRT